MVHFSLEVSIHQEESEAKPFAGFSSGDNDTSTTVVVASALRMTASLAGVSSSRSRWVGVFIPSFLTEIGFLHNLRKDPASSISRIKEPRSSELSQNLLSMIHPFLVGNFHIQAICCIRGARHSPADLVLLPLSGVAPSIVEEMVNATNGETIHVSAESTLKLLMIDEIQFSYDQERKLIPKAAARPTKVFDVPSCPVCLHRLEPSRLGLPKPRSTQFCSKFCPTSLNPSRIVECPRQRLLLRWPAPSFCSSCQIVEAYWNENTLESADPFCFDCALQETLWVCLTCGFVGCGRYSNKHAAQHFQETGHSFSLELATLRVWNYTDGEFAHRTDLLDCPSCPPLSRPWRRREQPPSSVNSNLLDGIGQHEKHPKKTIMIGEEYEALLYSALEDQAQHFEGEISRLRAELTAERVDSSKVTLVEAQEIATLKEEIDQFRLEIEHSGRELLDFQSQEVEHREKSQRLLREQQVTQELLSKLQEECANEHERGKTQVEELEQQIADLTANQRMMQQFSQNGELANAQIWGTSAETSPNRTGKKGKKTRRNLNR